MENKKVWILQEKIVSTTLGHTNTDVTIYATEKAALNALQKKKENIKEQFESVGNNNYTYEEDIYCVRAYDEDGDGWDYTLFEEEIRQ